ncbi:MAG: AAA family ATPase [Actinomycetota bacterium]
MRITGLHVENVKKLKVVDITPDEDMIILSGANEQGKTSVLDAIQLILSEKEATKNIKEPVRRGEKKAISYLYLGDPEYGDDGKEIECKPNLKATRTWTEKGSYLKLENMDGAVFKSPQSMLDKIIGDLTFDPLAFSNLREKDQLDTLLNLVDIGLDLEQWGLERREVYDERTAINRLISELEGQVKGLVVPEDAPDEEISAASVLEEQRKAQAVIDSNRQVREKLGLAEDAVIGFREDARRAEADIVRLKEELSVAQLKLTHLNGDVKEASEFLEKRSAAVAALIDPDLSVFETRIAEVEEINRQVRTKKQYARLLDNLALHKGKSDTATKRLSILDQQRADALKAANMPVDGLSFDESGVRFNDIPFKQCSSEERLRVSVAMGMALNPKLRVMFVRDGSLLDSKNREVIRQMAADNQYQIWMEITDDSGKVGLFLEDGEIKAKKQG